MEFSKSTLKHQTEVEITDGVPCTIEVLDGKFQAHIQPGDTYEQMRTELHKWLDRKFNYLYAAELGLMPERIAEGEKWKQLGMFDDAM